MLFWLILFCLVGYNKIISAKWMYSNCHLFYTFFSCGFKFKVLSLQEESTHLYLGSSKHFSPKNHKRKISNIHKDCLNYSNFSNIISMPNWVKILILPIVYILPELPATWLTRFYVIIYSFISSLVDINHFNLILWSNLNYKKLLNCQ